MSMTFSSGSPLGGTIETDEIVDGAVTSAKLASVSKIYAINDDTNYSHTGDTTTTLKASYAVPYDNAITEITGIRGSLTLKYSTVSLTGVVLIVVRGNDSTLSVPTPSGGDQWLTFNAAFTSSVTRTFGLIKPTEQVYWGNQPTSIIDLDSYTTAQSTTEFTNTTAPLTIDVYLRTESAGQTITLESLNIEILYNDKVA